MKTTRRIIVDEPGTHIEISTTRGDPSEPVRQRTEIVERRAEHQISVLRAALRRWGRKRLLTYSAVALVVTLVFGAVGLFTGFAFWLLFPLLAGTALTAGSFALGLLAGDQAIALLTDENEQLLETRSTRLAALLSTEKEPLYIETIESKLGWTEDAVVSGIKRLVEEGRVVEDLDLEDGRWHYRLATADDQSNEVPKTALAIEDRGVGVVGSREKKN